MLETVSEFTNPSAVFEVSTMPRAKPAAPAPVANATGADLRAAFTALLVALPDRQAHEIIAEVGRLASGQQPQRRQAPFVDTPEARAAARAQFAF